MRNAFFVLMMTCCLGFAAEPTYPKLPAAVSSAGAIASDGYVYLYGGHAGKVHSYDNKTTLGTFHRLKLDGGTAWEELKGGPIAQGVNLAAHGGKILRIGGMQPQNAPGEPANSLSLDSAAICDPKEKSWSDLPKLPKGRSSHDVVVVGDVVYVVGGWCMNGPKDEPIWHDTALSLDLAAKKPEWKAIAQPFQRRALTASAVGTKLYVLGGLNDEAKATNRVDVLDTVTGQWNQGPDLPGGKVGFSPAATTLDGKLIVSTVEAGVYRLNEKGDGWDKVGESKTKRLVHRLVPHGKSVLLIGGAIRGDGDAAVIEAVEVSK